MNHLFAVAARDEGNLWLILRIKRSPSGYYVLVPHPDRKWDAHASYHADGRFHIKTHGLQPLPPRQCQSLDEFRGSKHLGNFNVGNVGIVCEPSKYAKVMEVPADRLRGRVVAVDLIEPSCKPRPPEDSMLYDVVQEVVFDETVPQIGIRIGRLSFA